MAISNKLYGGEVSSSVNYVSVTEEAATVLNSAPVENEISVASIGSTLSDEAIEKICKSVNVTTTKNSNVNSSQLATTTYKNFTPYELFQIKSAIYDLHHQKTTDNSSTPNTGTTDTDTPDDTGSDTESKAKASFLNDFSDTDTMFEYLNTLNSEITKDTGITRAQLVKLTQDDDWEDSNYDFFGSLNRIFDELDKDDNSVLSYEEIKDFIKEELGSDFNEYSEKVNEYCNEIQKRYETYKEKEKLKFAIDRAAEYLEAAGLEQQLEALDRLLLQEDKYSYGVAVGNIAIADLNEGNTSGYTTLGSYQYYCWTYSGIYTSDEDTEAQLYTNKNDSKGDYKIWAEDEDFSDEDGKYDLGITLDESLLDGKWYELVNTLVHELTHATAYQYFTDDGGTINQDMVKALHTKGRLTDDEYDYIMTNWDEISFSGIYDKQTSGKNLEMRQRLDYLIYCQWGEYSAYQADADYNDSIGQDVYFQTGDNTTTIADGKDEADKIREHIPESYDNEIEPDYKWWSYA